MVGVFFLVLARSNCLGRHGCNLPRDLPGVDASSNFIWPEKKNFDLPHLPTQILRLAPCRFEAPPPSVEEVLKRRVMSGKAGQGWVRLGKAG